MSGFFIAETGYGHLLCSAMRQGWIAFSSRCWVNLNKKTKRKGKEAWPWDFPGGPVADSELPSSQCRGPGFDPWTGNYAATKIL